MFEVEQFFHYREHAQQIKTIIDKNMKKSMISLAVLLTVLSGSAFAQSTTISTNPNQSTADTTKQQGSGDSTKTAGGAGKQGSSMGKADTKSGTAASGSAATGKDSSKTAAGSGAGNGAAAIGNAGQTPKTGTTPQSTVKSQPANMVKGAIRKTEPDTAVKAGSGSSPRNTKNNTGKTGNYRNDASKKSRANE